LNASLVFIDETGLLMAPLVRRTWAPRGQTPILYQRTRSHDKVSVIGALTLSPRRTRVGLYFALLPGENAKAGHFRRFLADLRRHLQRPLVVVWDRLAGHRAQELREALDRSGRVHLEFLPPYAPELNPVEMLWGYVKMNPLANHPATHAPQLAQRAQRHFLDLRHRPALLRSFFRATPLFSRL
jgi:transposase